MKKRTDMDAMKFLRHAGLGMMALLTLPALPWADAVTIHGTSWVQAGRLMHQTDTIGYNYNGNWFQSATAQVTAIATIGSNWDGALGIGARQIQKGATGNNVAMGNPTTGSYLWVAVEPYITEARFTYTYGDDKATSPLQLTFGSFNYDYNPDVKDLGLYLTRGTVYPSLIFSGFETDETIGIANSTGMNLRSHTGPFTHDILFTSETKIKPLFDYSLAYIGKYKPNESFTVGVGANFYRALPIQSALTTPRGHPDVFTEPQFAPVTKYDRNQFYLDSTAAGVDTVRFSFKGIKVGAFFSWDLKSLIGQGAMGPEDLKLYGEAALLGVKNYPGIYNDRYQRIPVMMGLNLPMFKLLDHLSLEVEWYGSPYRNDYYKIMKDFSPIPVSNQYLGRNVVDSAGVKYIEYKGALYPNEDPYNVEDMHRDDWKWALHGSKTIKDHIRISGQIANDHFRTGGTYLADTYEQAFTTLKDWYFMMKLGYFF